MEPIDERVHKFQTSHLSVPKHHRPCEAVGIHKRVNRIHDPVKIAVSYFVFEDESPIPPDRSDFDKGPTEPASVDTLHISEQAVTENQEEEKEYRC